MFYKVVLVVAVLSLDLLTGSNFTNHSSSGIYTECFPHSFFNFIIHVGSALQDLLFVEIYYYCTNITNNRSCIKRSQRLNYTFALEGEGDNFGLLKLSRAWRASCCGREGLVMRG